MKTAEEVLRDCSDKLHYESWKRKHNATLQWILTAMEEYAASQTEQLREENASLQSRIKELEQEKEGIVKWKDADISDLQYEFDYYKKVSDIHREKYKSRIKELEASQSKWVSVTERLPEIDGFVMANDTDSLTPVKVLLFVHGNFYFEAHGVSMDYTNHISHWQPLPSKPE